RSATGCVDGRGESSRDVIDVDGDSVGGRYGTGLSIDGAFESRQGDVRRISGGIYESRERARRQAARVRYRLNNVVRVVVNVLRKLAISVDIRNLAAGTVVQNVVLVAVCIRDHAQTAVGVIFICRRAKILRAWTGICGPDQFVCVIVRRR